MIKKILLAVDLSIHTSQLLQHAASLSNQYQASMSVVHVVEPLGTLGYALLKTYLEPEASEAITTTGMDNVVEQIRAQVIDIVTDEYMTGEMKLPRLEQVIVKAGEPLDVITSTAKEINADVIVIGTHSPDTTKAHLGNVPQKLMSYSRVPVYLVPLAQPIWQQKSDGSSFFNQRL